MRIAAVVLISSVIIAGVVPLAFSFLARHLVGQLPGHPPLSQFLWILIYALGTAPAWGLAGGLIPGLAAALAAALVATLTFLSTSGSLGNLGLLQFSALNGGIAGGVVGSFTTRFTRGGPRSGLSSEGRVGAIWYFAGILANTIWMAITTCGNFVPWGVIIGHFAAVPMLFGGVLGGRLGRASWEEVPRPTLQPGTARPAARVSYLTIGLLALVALIVWLAVAGAQASLRAC